MSRCKMEMTGNALTYNQGAPSEERGWGVTAGVHVSPARAGAPDHASTSRVPSMLASSCGTQQ